MKLLLFSDLHCDAGAARRLVERAPGAGALAAGSGRWRAAAPAGALADDPGVPVTYPT